MRGSTKERRRKIEVKNEGKKIMWENVGECGRMRGKLSGRRGKESEE